MMFIRRKTPVLAVPAFAPAEDRPTSRKLFLLDRPESECVSGRHFNKSAFRRVERVSSPVEPHWYVTSLTDQLAISTIASRFRKPPSLFRVVGYQE